MSAKHTAGPWTIIPARAYDGEDEDLNGAYTSPASIEGKNGDPVCIFGDCEGSGTLYENEADYRLIAAAPDLLEAVHALRGFMPPAGDDRVTHALRQADAAIAKATAA